MKRMARAVLLLVACGLSYGAQAQTCTNTGTGNWGTAGIWNCTLPAGARVPLNTDNVVIINNTTVTVNIAGAVAGSVTINGGANATSLTMGGVGTTLTVTNAGGRSGNVVINAPSAAVTKQISVGARSLTVTGSVSIGSATAGANNANIAQLAITSGTANIGSLAVAGGTVNSIAQATVTTGTLNINGNASIASGTLGRGLMTLTGGTINVTGNLDVSTATSTNNTGDATVEVTNAAGLLNVTGNATVTGGGPGAGSADRDALLRVTVASNPGRGISIGGSLTIDSTIAGSSAVTLGTNSRMSVAGNVNNGDSLTIGAGLFTMPTPGSTLTTRNNARAATTSVTTGTLDARNVVVDSGGLGLSRLLLSSTGTINVQGDLSVTAAASTGDAGDATVEVTNAGGLLNVTGNATVNGGAAAIRDALLRVTTTSNAGRGITIAGNLNVNSTVAGSSSVTLGAAGSLLTVSGAVTNNDTVTVGTGTFTVNGNYTNNNQAFAVATTVSTGTLTVGGILSNAATETITISSTGIVNANGGFINSGTFTNTAAGQLFLRGAINTIDGTFTRGTGTATMNGAAAQALSGTALFPPTAAGDGFYNLVINNAAGVTLGSNVTAKNILTLTSGEVTTGANVLIAEVTCATGVVRPPAGGHVVGNLQKNIPAGASNCTYEIGSAGAYTPAALVFATAGAGRLIGRVSTPDHPNIGTSGLDAGKSLNRWWTLTTTGVTGTALPATGTYGATFTFLNPSGFDAGATPANFETERWSGAAWLTTTTGARTATTTQATGVTALGDFAVAEKSVAITPPDSFNAVEVGAAINGRIFTKLRGTGFTLDIVAILGGVLYNTFNESVTVDLVTGGSGGLNCGGGALTVVAGPVDVTLVNGRVTTPAFNLATAYPNVRARIRYPTAAPTLTTCSSDNFSIRPPAFTVTSTVATNTGTLGAPAIKTGANFNLTAAGGAGYAGTPINNTTGNVTGTPTAGTIGGTFNAAVGGTASGNFFYSEVGHFGLGINAVADSSFSSVDPSGTDCTNNFSNTLVGGRYGCQIGSTAVTQSTGVSGFGRFIPDNFNVSYNVPLIAPACTGFGYVGQMFNYSTLPVMTITARNGNNNGLANATTVNYAGSYMKFANDNTSLAQAAYDTQLERYARFDALGGGNTPALDTAGLPATTADPVISVFAAGVGTFTFAGGSGFRFTRSTTTPSAPFDADLALALNVIDADGVTFAGNPASFGAASAGSGMLFSDGNAGTTNDKHVRYGRLRLGNASGSQVLSLRVPVEAQYWNGTAFITNTLDNCTALAAGNIGLGNYVGSLGAGETTASIVSNPLQAGRSAIQLSAPGAGNPGSVDVTLNLGSGAAADACPAFTPAAAAGNLAHLRGRWCNPPGVYTKDPSARVRFGIRSNNDPTIYMRESQN